MIRTYIARTLRIDPTTKPRLYAQIYDSAEVGCASYGLDLIFAAAIATLGLVLNSPAVVIGAMLISPLMGPILAAGLAFAASDVYLGIRAFWGLFVSIASAVAFSAALVWLLPFQSPTAEILARTQPNLLDLGVAIFSGLAGSFVMARSLSGGAASALPGVAIAVALMPPLCTVGFGIGSGWNWSIISGAALLFITNLVAIAGSAFLVFYLAEMDAPEVRASVSESTMRQATGNRLYALLHDTAIGKLLGDVGQLRWRITMVAITLAMLFVPLRSSLMQLRDETLCRAAAREAVRVLVSPEHVLSQRLEILPDRVLQSVVTTTHVAPNLVSAAEAELTRRTGRTGSVQVRQVANEEELITLRERLRTPAPPPAPPDLKELSANVRPLVESPLREVWPSEAAELAEYEVGFGAKGLVLRLAYHSPRALDAPAQEAIRNALRLGLRVEAVAAVFDWRGPKKENPAAAGVKQ